MAAPVITHRKVSGKAQGPDLTRVYGNHWDDTHVITGLENVDNTSDVNKPVSTAQQAAINSGVASVTKTSIGLGNVDNTSDVNKPLSTADTTALALKAPLASPSFTGAVSSAGPVSVTDTTASTSTTTGALKVSGGLGVAGAGWFGGNVNASKFVQTSSPSTSVAIDTSGGGAFSLTVANGANGAIAIQFGLLVLHEITALGDVSFWLVSGASASLIGQNGTGSYVASTTTPAAGKISVAYNGTAFAIYNNRGGSSSFFVGQYQT